MEMNTGKDGWDSKVFVGFQEFGWRWWKADCEHWIPVEQFWQGYFSALALLAEFSADENYGAIKLSIKA